MERKVHLVARQPQKPKLLRVVAYARVSSGKDAMLHSLAAQVDYYQNLIRSTPAPRIKEIIQNEKYIGNVLLQKFYRNNHIEKKKTRNQGELQQILVEEAHEPIIDRETFEEAQRILFDRHMQYAHEGATNRYALTGMIKCGCCGKNYQRKMYKQGPVWMCSTYLRRGKKYCPESRQISEKILNQLIADFEITQIDVPEPNELIFTLADGTKVQKHWENPSRSESWTLEMREEARRKSCRKSQ